MTIAGIIFDFDGVLIESELVGNQQIAAYLTNLGHPTSVEDSITNFMGLAGADFAGALERWIGRPLPADFETARRAQDEACLADGIDAVTGAIAFVLALPPALPRAIASSSSSHWIRTHLDHLGLSEAFGGHIYSGREHVAHGKPAPDLYLHAAAQLGVDIAETLIIEDSPVGVTGALASGGQVVGLCAGNHCSAGHADELRARGVTRIAHGFDEIAAMLGLTLDA